MFFDFFNYRFFIHKKLKEKSVLLVDSENLRYAVESLNSSFTNFPDLLKKSVIFQIDERCIYFAKLPKQTPPVIRKKQSCRLDLYRKNKYTMVQSGNVQWDAKEGKLGKEKGVDVQISLDIVRYAALGVKNIYLVSSDSDILPAVKRAKELYVCVHYVSTGKAINRGVKYHCDKYIEIPENYII